MSEEYPINGGGERVQNSSQSSVGTLDRPVSTPAIVEKSSSEITHSPPKTAKDPFAGLSPMSLAADDMNPGLQLGHSSPLTRASLDEQYQPVSLPAQEPSDIRIPPTTESSTTEQKKNVYTMYVEGGASAQFAGLKETAKTLQKEYELEHTKYEVHWDTQDIGRQEGEKKLAYAGRLIKKFLPQLVPNGYKMLINALPQNSIERYLAGSEIAKGLLEERVALYMDMHHGQLPTKLSELPELVTKQQKKDALDAYEKYREAANANTPYEENGELQFYEGLNKLSELAKTNTVAERMNTLINTSVNGLVDKLIALDPHDTAGRQRILYEERQKMNTDFWTFAGDVEDVAVYQDISESADARQLLAVLRSSDANAAQFVDAAIKTAERITRDERNAAQRLTNIAEYNDREIRIVAANVKTQTAKDTIYHYLFHEHKWMGSLLKGTQAGLVYGRGVAGVVTTGMVVTAVSLGLSPFLVSAGTTGGLIIAGGAGIARMADTISNAISEQREAEQRGASGELSVGDSAPLSEQLEQWKASPLRESGKQIVSAAKLLTKEGRERALAGSAWHITSEDQWRIGSLSMSDVSVQERSYDNVLGFIQADQEQGYISLESIHAAIREAKTPEEKHKALVAASDKIGLLRASLRLENVFPGSYIQGMRLHILAEMASLEDAVETHLHPDSTDLADMFTIAWSEIKGEQGKNDRDRNRILNGVSALAMTALTGSTVYKMYQYGLMLSHLSHTDALNLPASGHVRNTSIAQHADTASALTASEQSLQQETSKRVTISLHNRQYSITIPESYHVKPQGADAVLITNQDGKPMGILDEQTSTSTIQAYYYANDKLVEQDYTANGTIKNLTGKNFNISQGKPATDMSYAEMKGNTISPVVGPDGTSVAEKVKQTIVNVDGGYSVKNDQLWSNGHQVGTIQMGNNNMLMVTINKGRDGKYHQFLVPLTNKGYVLKDIDKQLYNQGNTFGGSSSHDWHIKITPWTPEINVPNPLPPDPGSAISKGWEGVSKWPGEAWSNVSKWPEEVGEVASHVLISKAIPPWVTIAAGGVVAGFVLTGVALVVANGIKKGHLQRQASQQGGAPTPTPPNVPTPPHGPAIPNTQHTQPGSTTGGGTHPNRQPTRTRPTHTNGPTTGPGPNVTRPPDGSTPLPPNPGLRPRPTGTVPSNPPEGDIPDISEDEYEDESPINLEPTGTGEVTPAGGTEEPESTVYADYKRWQKEKEERRRRFEAMLRLTENRTGGELSIDDLDE